MSDTPPATLARRYCWWQSVEESLDDVPGLLRQILRLGTSADYAAALEMWGADAVRAALETAPPGALDDRSWYFWRLHFRLAEMTPPVRSFR